MNNVFDPVNLIILVAAVVIFFRLRSVLGSRTGNERRWDLPAPPSSADKETAEKSEDDNVVPLPSNGPEPEPIRGYQGEEETKPVWEGYAEAGSRTAQGLEKIAGSDASFNPRQFIDGAKMAYEMIVTAFAGGDKKTLKPLLGKDVYDGFAGAIDERNKSKETMETRFVGIDEATITGAALNGKRAQITIRFTSELITATRAADGKVIDGDPDKIGELIDVWTFERDVSSRDPNWKLVATEDPDA